MKKMIKILMIEDDADFCYLIRKTLEKQKDFQVVGQCSDGFQALSLAKKYQPDIVLLDLNLSSGGLDGIRIGKEIRQIDGVSFDDPSKLVAAITRLAEVQQKLSNTRIKAVADLDKAKEKIKDELRAAITADPELLQRLIDIIDKVQI